MISALIREFLIPLLIFLVLRWILRSVVVAFRTSAPRPPAGPQRPPAPAGGTLVKDPVCGIYVSAESSVTQIVQGQALHFCSQECSDKYRAGARPR
jgi:YHS domain-containing protein